VLELVGKIQRRIMGGRIDRALLPILGVTFSGSVTGGMVYPFLGIWMIERLGASNFQMMGAFAGAAAAGAVGAYAGGHLSDRFGRKPLILVGWSVNALTPLGLLAAGDQMLIGFGMLWAFSLFGSVGHAADQALVPDILPPERHEAGYASVRVIQNFGVVLGPPLGGLFLLGENWDRLFVAVACVGFIPFLLALRFIPRRGRYTPERGGNTGVLRLILRDPIFLLFFISGAFSTLAYVAYETLLPISLVDTHGLSPSTWGFLVALNPLMVTLFQLRITAWLAHVPASIKLSVAILLMGLPFLALIWTGALYIVAIAIVIFVIGEMLWIPTSQAVVARIAPAENRGAYIGAFGGTWAIGWSLTPSGGLFVRGSLGDAAMWLVVAGVAAIGAITAFVACTRAFGLTGAAEGELEEAAEAAVAAS
jgi:predicted MFS family arabinose efflux permease